MGKGKNRSRKLSNAARRKVADAPHPQEKAMRRDLFNTLIKEKEFKDKAVFNQEDREINFHDDMVVDAETDLSQTNIDEKLRKFEESPLDFDDREGSQWKAMPGFEAFPRHERKDNPYGSHWMGSQLIN